MSCFLCGRFSPDAEKSSFGSSPSTSIFPRSNFTPNARVTFSGSDAHNFARYDSNLQMEYKH